MLTYYDVLPRCSNAFWAPKYNTPRAVFPAAKQYRTIFLVSVCPLQSIQKPSDRQSPSAANLEPLGFPLVIGMDEFRVFQVGTANPI